jgi:hypothetical protein
MPDLEGIDSEEEEEEPEDGDEELACNTDDNTDNYVDELEALSGEEQATFLDATAAVTACSKNLGLRHFSKKFIRQSKKKFSKLHLLTSAD